MQIIACTGDSHTWGQCGGDSLAEYAAWRPPIRAGDLRLLSFRGSCYVNLLRRRLSAVCDARAAEYDAGMLARTLNLALEEDCAAVGNEPAELIMQGSLLRLQWKLRDSSALALLSADGGPDTEIPLPAASAAADYHTHFVQLPPGAHRLRLRGLPKALLYRAETYGGDFAVINLGVGSTPVEKYRREYFPAVEALRPALVLAEGHTINDWLTGESPAEYGLRLRDYLRRIRACGAQPILLTVSPILGPQAQPHNDRPYGEFLEASAAAAQAERVPAAAAHAMFQSAFAGLGEDEIQARYYADRWHPNAAGHRLYAEAAWPLIAQALGLPEGGEDVRHV